MTAPTRLQNNRPGHVKQSLEGFQELLRDLDAIVWEADARSCNFTFVSAAAERITGFPTERWCEPNFWADHIHPDDRDRAVSYCLTATREGRDHEFEYRFPTADGRILWLRDIVHVAKGEDGAATRLRGIMLDVTERKIADLALSQSEDRFRNLLHNLGVGVMVVGPETETLLHNAAACELLGLSEGELLGRDLYDPDWNVIHEDGTPFPPAGFPVVRALATGRPVRNVVMGVYRPRSGDRVWLLVNATPEANPDGRVRQVIVTFGDITEARNTEAQLRLLEKAVSRLNDVVLITEAEPLEDPGPRILYANDAFEAVTGFSRDEVLGRPVYMLFGPQTDREVVARMVRDLRARRPAQGEFVKPRKGGGEYRVECGAVAIADDLGRPTHLVIIERDVSERRHLEEQLRHSQKLEAVGMLAGGIAHDFNNLLTAMLGYSELLLAKIRPGEPYRREIEEIRRASERAASLTRQLLAFSRKQMLQPRVIDLNSLVANLMDMLHRLLGEDVELRTCFAPALGRVKVDPSQVEQVIVNLAVNARDAMPRGGALLLSTENMVVDEEAARRNPGVEPGRYVALHVEDTGVGMDTGTMAQIFEPFFTTKEVGRGTGLGLATVYGIVKQSGGAIWVDSEKGRGTRFRILLPTVDVPAAGEPVADGPGPEAAGSETVLLVEDEPSVRVLSRETLRECGYQVLEAGDGEEALRVAKAHDGPIHLLLTDVIMPRLRGRALADQLRRSRPGIKLLYISGYPDTSLLHQGVLEAGTPLLEKPFTPDTLVRRVRQALDDGRTQG